jgi:hypothetical protein
VVTAPRAGTVLRASKSAAMLASKRRSKALHNPCRTPTAAATNKAEEEAGKRRKPLPRSDHESH